MVDHVTSRWATLILASLVAGPHRFSELNAKIGGISEKMLSQNLRTLVRDGLVKRTVTPTVPPQVSYGHTPLGADLTVQLWGWSPGSATTPTTFSKRRSATTLPRSTREESTAALRSRPLLALPALFELFVKRERPQQVSYRILPNFAEFLVGRLDRGCRDRLLQMRHPRAAARVYSTP